MAAYISSRHSKLTFENDRQDLGVLQNIGVNAGVTQFGLKAGLAAYDVLLALLALEPLLDLDARLIGLADVQPVAAQALGGLDVKISTISPLCSGAS